MTVSPRPHPDDFTGANFKTSTYTSGSGECVEAALLNGWTGVRDTKDVARTTLVFSGPGWDAFLKAAKTSTLTA